MTWCRYQPFYERHYFRKIGFGATISAPHMHAHACENLLELLPQTQNGGEEPPRILDVGSGSGYCKLHAFLWLVHIKLIPIGNQ